MAPLESEPSDVASSFTEDDIHKNIMSRARDEAADLRQQICQLQMRLEEVEDDRNYNAAKAREFEELLKSFKKEHIHEELVKKSLQMAEMSMSVDKFREEIKSLKTQNKQIEHERSLDHQNMERLSGVVKSLQSCVEGGDDDSDDEDVILTPDKALDMTLKNMKYHIEFLEDERQQLSVKCKDQQNKISNLEKESDLKDIKINMLEEMFRLLNDEQERSRGLSIPAPPSSSKATSQASAPSSPVASPLSPSTPSTTRTRRARRVGLAKVNSAPDLMAEEKGERRSERSSRRVKGISQRSLRRINKEHVAKATVAVDIDGREGVYTGPTIDGKPNGTGNIRFSNGDTYLGEVLDGKLHGKGTLYPRMGTMIRGKFANNKPVEN